MSGYVTVNSALRDILHLRMFGQSMIVLGSAEIIHQFLEKRAANTSNRKQSPMIELYKGLSAASILKVVYNIRIEDEKDPLVGMIEAAFEGVNEGVLPGRFLVEFMPFLRYVQPWIPGMQSPKLWEKWQSSARKMANEPYMLTKAQMVSFEQGSASQSIVANLLSRLSQSGEVLPPDEETIKGVGMVAFEAGTDTVFSTLQAVFLAMSLYPEVLGKAHAELDAVVGSHRLPDFSDRDSLVYINALNMEAMRWNVVLPLCMPHATTEDDELNGYFIPAGTVLMPATWACMQDPAVFENPDEFRPERFIRNGQLDVTVRDPAAHIFGYGRRICPGRYFAEAAMFINVASALHVFDITPPLGGDGKSIKVEYNMTDGHNSYPEDVRCTVRPRSAAAEALILSYASEAHAAMEQ
ncbi:cytochrome P450 [Dichomitus squalens]|uniref:Cytochrome P450 n=1 Tax=Dichomitus squalens TaxID=114155 RepID=A0A4Q9ME79_9APHY|nr:cytochrome P450 [Dichomitus squalens]